MSKFRLFALIFIASGCSYAFGENSPLSASEEIDLLITKVEVSACTFHRNGSSHSAVDAADHLRLKLRRGKRYAKTAENFIERLASKSSFSGKAYQIECNGASPILMEEWLNDELVILRS